MARLHCRPEIHSLVDDEEVGELVHRRDHQSRNDAQKCSGECEDRDHDCGDQRRDEEVEAFEEVGKFRLPAGELFHRENVAADQQRALQYQGHDGVQNGEDDGQQETDKTID